MDPFKQTLSRITLDFENNYITAVIDLYRGADLPKPEFFRHFSSTQVIQVSALINDNEFPHRVSHCR